MEEKKGKGEQKFAAAAAAAAAAADVILEAMVDGVVVIDINGNITQCNKAFADMFGYESPQEVAGDNITELMAKSDIEKTFAAMKETFTKGLPTKNLEVRAITKQKKEFPMLLNGTALKDLHGKIVGLLGVSRDITELKRLQEKEKEAAAMKRAADVIEAMGDALILANMDGKIVSINPAFEKLTGYDKSELIEKEATEFLPKWFKGEDMENMMNVFGVALEGKVPAPFSVSVITKGGEVVSATFTVSFIKDAEGKPTAIIATIKDITKLKRAEEKLKKRMIELERFTEVAVGREERVIELKKEVENLKEKIRGLEKK